MDWKQRMRARMKDLGITQNQLAARIHVTQGAITRWLSNGVHQNQPSLETFDRIAEALGVDVVWLLHGKEAADSPEEVAMMNAVRQMSAEQRDALRSVITLILKKVDGDS